MDDNEKKILVTGANGFVGSALVGELQNAGRTEVYGIGSGSKKGFYGHNAPIKMFSADVSEYETLMELENIPDIDTVVHAAGLAHRFGRTEREDFRRVNVRGTENICRLAKQIRAVHFILISSVAVYGDHGDASIDEGFECRPAGDYAESKLESETAAIAFCENNGIGLTILRLATVIGEGDRGNTARLITSIDNNRFFWIGNGTNKKSLIYKNDVARGAMAAIAGGKPERTGIYNLTGGAIKMSEVVAAIAQNLRKKPLPVRIPESLVRAGLRIGKFGIPFKRLRKIENTLEKWLSDDIFSGRKFFREFGFEPETPIVEALRRQVEFYMEQKKRKTGR